MQSKIILIHKQTKREFIISSKTKVHILKLLIKKAFHFQTDIQCLRHLNSHKTLQLSQIFKFPNQKQYQIVLQDQSDDKSKSCSQKTMSRLSGRKHPPSEKQLIDSKFYVDDFQLFMTEVDQSKANKFYGIVFFSNRKKAIFLGKKILRELIFQFDQIQFFYALHPIKMHNTSALLGQVLVFSLFKGKIMVHERQFPEQITAAEQISSYLKNLVKIGALKFKSSQQVQKKKSKNLISVSQQRSFDQKCQVLPKQIQFTQKNLSRQFFKMKQVIQQQQITPIRFQSTQQKYYLPKNDQQQKSPITNQISFESQFYQPQWFKQGQVLNRIQKSFISAYVKNNHQQFITYCQQLELKKKDKQENCQKLLKQHLKSLINHQLSIFQQDQIKFLYDNQQNRKKFTFSLLLKLFKFGKIQEFVENFRKKMLIQNQYNIQFPVNSMKRRKSSYLQLAKQIHRKKKIFSIKLMLPDQNNEAMSPQRQHISLVGKHLVLNMKNEQIAKYFHQKKLPKMILPANLKFSPQYSQADIAHMKQLLLHNDCFLIQNFVANPHSLRRQQFSQFPCQTVKKYLKSIQPRYSSLHQRTSLSSFCQSKLEKLQIFMSLLYFVYKQRHISRKLLKAFFYLYIWSDLNVLSAFQLYLLDRDLHQFMDTLYTVDYNYYKQGRYGIDMNELENFTIPIEQQLIMLFLISDQIPNIEQRLAVEKFIRAGDMQLYQIYHNFTLVGQQFTKKALQMCVLKKQQLQEHVLQQDKQQVNRLQRNKQRCNFIQQIKPVHFKSFNKVSLIQQLINLDQPLIHQIFDIYDKTNQLVKWIDSFTEYIISVDQKHMDFVMTNMAKDNGLQWDKIKVRKQMVKGVYEAYIITQDKDDAVDSLQHILKRLERQQKSSPTSKSHSP